MAKAPHILPWNKHLDPRLLAGFGGLLHRAAYDEALRFLSTESLVSEELKRVDAASAATRFEAFLRGEEQRFGFSAQVIRIENDARILKASLFWTHVYAKKPLTDLGAGPIHGPLSHRLQWVLLGRWNERDSRRPLGRPSSELAELYRNLACANARAFKAGFAEQVATNTLAAPINTGKENPFLAVWDAVVDAGGSDNARTPEYITAYVAARFPALAGRMTI